MAGLEPAVLELQSKALSILATYTNIGAGSGARTHDLLIKSQLLYHLSYTCVGAVLEDNRKPFDRLTQRPERP